MDDCDGDIGAGVSLVYQSDIPVCTGKRQKRIYPIALSGAFGPVGADSGPPDAAVQEFAGLETGT